jgi:hypothetical protein
MRTTNVFLRPLLGAGLASFALVSCETTVVHPTEYQTLHRYTVAGSKVDTEAALQVGLISAQRSVSPIAFSSKTPHRTKP